MKAPSPFLEWLVDDDIPNCGHLYRDGVWYGSVEKDTLDRHPRWAVTVNNTHVAACPTVEEAKRWLEKMAKSKEGQ